MRTDLHTAHGLTFRIEVIHDADAGYPWDNMECLGDVSDWTSRSKAPGERVLNEGRFQKRFYDFAGAVAKARREGATGPQAVEQADAEFDYLRRWCNDDWHYVGLTLTVLDGDGGDTEHTESLWGIDGDGDLSTHIGDLADELGHRLGWSLAA